MDIVVCNQLEKVGRYVAYKIGVGNLAALGDYQAIGLERDGVLVSGAIYTDFNGSNVWSHFATDVPISKYFLAVGFDYPFNKLNCNRISGWVESDNLEAIRLNKHFGYTIEATLSKAGRDGQDVHIMRMFKEDCRFLKLGAKYGL